MHKENYPHFKIAQGHETLMEMEDGETKEVLCEVQKKPGMEACIVTIEGVPVEKMEQKSSKAEEKEDSAEEEEYEDEENSTREQRYMRAFAPQSRM